MADSPLLWVPIFQEGGAFLFSFPITFLDPFRVVTSRKQGQGKIGRARSGKVGTLRAFFLVTGGGGHSLKGTFFVKNGIRKDNGLNLGALPPHPIASQQIRPQGAFPWLWRCTAPPHLQSQGKAPWGRGWPPRRVPNRVLQSRNPRVIFGVPPPEQTFNPESCLDFAIKSRIPSFK